MASSRSTAHEFMPVAKAPGMLGTPGAPGTAQGLAIGHDSDRDHEPADAPQGAASDRDAPAELWRRWCGSRDGAARDMLIRHYLCYARTIAATTFSRRTHNDIAFEEYMQLASLGLIESVDRFDPAFGVLFRTFASKRIQGAMLNGLVRLSEKNQQIAVRNRLRRERLESVKAQAARSADSSVACEAESPPRSAEALFRYLAEVGVGLALGVLLEGSGMVDAEAFGAEAQAPSPEVSYFRQAEIRQLQQRIKDLVGRLSAQQQTVVRCHYLQELPFEEIARTMGLTRGRVSQVHKQALMRLRELFSQDARLDLSC